jgi:hypothetical protein
MREIRILITDEDFAKLCKTGFVEYQKLKIEITSDQFDELIEGKIVSTNYFNQPIKIALQDIGYDRIAKHLSTSTIY